MSLSTINVNNQKVGDIIEVKNVVNPIGEQDLDIRDKNGNVLVAISNHIKTKQFDSETAAITKNVDEYDLCLSDDKSNKLVGFSNGHIYTKHFNSENVNNNIKKLQTDIEQLENRQIEKDQSLTKQYVTVFEDNFNSSNNKWLSSWNLNTQNKTFTPSALNVKASTSPRFYCDKRCVTFRVILYNNAIFKVMSENAQENSEYIFNMSSKTITQIAIVPGYDNKTFTFTNNIIDGRIYQISISITNFNTYISIIDTVDNITIETYFFGREGYELKGHLTFIQTSGTLISLKSVNVSILKEPTIVFVGDSITAGAYFTNPDPDEDMFVYHMYSKIVSNHIGDCCSLSVGGGGMTNFEEMWTNELSFQNPKAICALMGTNGGFTEERMKQIIRNFLTKTNIIAINHLFANDTLYHLAQYNILLEQILSENEFSNIMTARFDIATSIEKSLNTSENITLDGSLMYDRVIHPNYLGSLAMVQRLRLDCPKLFRLN